uniref:ADP-ribosylation factor n=1 Tax=Palpitomonas bilix TaxID=652834 RepID=A0A7S3G226_9EUKA|mmetsp:Transcript_19409/g.49754  ORF Transcript_19409/g.49754 Transcript_19409/m.49754 type:complete len:196 (+) Transcript_19409:270-857(+)
MGGTLAKYFRKLVGTRREVHMMMVGLDAAGKTTILYKLKLNEKITTLPTIGFNVEKVVHNNLAFTIWDVGGDQKVRPVWYQYHATHGNNDGIMFVVDSADRERVGIAKKELHDMLKEDYFRDSILLVLANKQEIPQAMTADEVSEKLDLHLLDDTRQWMVQAASGVSGEGLHEGLDWVSDQLSIKKRRRSNNKRK